MRQSEPAKYEYNLQNNSHIRCIDVIKSDTETDKISFIVAIGSYNGEIQVLDAFLEGKSISFKLISTLVGHGNEVKDIKFSSDSKFLASCGRDKSIWIWEDESDRHEWFEDSVNVSGVIPNAHKSDIKKLCWVMKHQNILASASFDNRVSFFIQNHSFDWIKLHEIGNYCL